MTDTPDPDSAMAAEFGVVARWTGEAITKLGPEYAIPAACRGSASPSALSWLGEACELAPGATLLDVGGGMGGPAAWAAERFDVHPVVVEPMVAAAQEATRLFGIPALAAAGDAVPVAGHSADAVWCLGVLCTVQDPAALLAELRRILKPAAPLGLLVFVADQPRPAGAPEGNNFPHPDDLPRLLDDAGFVVVEQRDGTGEAPLAWTERADAVDDAIRTAHGDDPRWADAKDQEERIGSLLAAGTVRGVLIHAR